MKNNIDWVKYSSIYLMILISCAKSVAQKPIDHVDMFIGSTGEHATEYGGTTPAVSEPFGMTQWCATTRLNGISRTMYHYKDKQLLGFMATHQPAVWMGDYGFLTLMPQMGELKLGAKERAVAFKHEDEIASPYFYQVTYGNTPDEKIQTMLTATSRCSYFKIKYKGNGKAILFLEAGRAEDGGEIEIFPERQEIRINNRERHDKHLGPPLKNLQGSYVLKFSKPFTAYGTWKNDEVIPDGTHEIGAHIGGFIEFGTDNPEVDVRIGSSFIGYDQALVNLEKELPGRMNFDAVKKKVKKVWEQNLNKIIVKGGTADQMQIFYTAFFRTMQYPREFSEYGRYYSPFDDQVHQGISYTAFSLWDTFRAQHPWLLLTQPQRINAMITSLIQMYHEGGWIPKWPNPSYTNIMIGTHADAVIADAYVNGFRGYDLEEAYQGIRKNAFMPPSGDDRVKWGDRLPWTGHYEARGGLSNYLKLGYVAYDKTYESVSRTLEFALDDYCVAQMAAGLGHTADYRILMDRSRNYRHLFNPATQFFQARDSRGQWGGIDEGFTEGGRWTYRFCVMQDIPGLITLLGGQSNFITALDKNFDENHYHHDNEPGHHFAYMYNYCNRLDKTQSRIPEIMKRNYQNKPDGLSGNDDCGQMSAWYLFSSLGFYPLAPASGEYALGIPAFKEIEVKLDNGKKLCVKAPLLDGKQLLTDIRWNGKKLGRSFLPVREVLKGGVLEFRKEN